MPTEYVEVLPDAIGRTLNDYPGLAGSHRLAFDGENLGLLSGTASTAVTVQKMNAVARRLAPSLPWGLCRFSACL